MVETSLILNNEWIARDVYKMDLTCSFADQVLPGQFVMVQVPGFFLRRPISVCAVQEGILTIVYKVLGEGTAEMAAMGAGEELNLFGPLGHGFDMSPKESVLLIGGGVGVPPLYETACRYRNAGTQVDVVLGFNTVEDMFFEEAFQRLGCRVFVATMDGSFGVRGTVLDAVEAYHLDSTYMQACGPLPMLRALNERYPEGEISLESRMACGMGACMGCVVKDTEGNSLRVCKDGPVFPVKKVAL